MNLEKGTVLRCTKDLRMYDDLDVAFTKGKLYEIVDVDNYDDPFIIYELDSDICEDGITHSLERSDIEEHFVVEFTFGMGHASEALDRTEIENEWDKWEWLF